MRTRRISLFSKKIHFITLVFIQQNIVFKQLKLHLNNLIVIIESFLKFVNKVDFFQKSKRPQQKKQLSQACFHALKNIKKKTIKIYLIEIYLMTYDKICL